MASVCRDKHSSRIGISQPGPRPLEEIANLFLAGRHCGDGRAHAGRDSGVDIC